MSTQRRVYDGLITKLEKNEIFVFGSNPEGRHGRGAANTALKKFGAKWGQGRGLQGNSYGLITKNLKSNYTEASTQITYQKRGPRSVDQPTLITNIQELYTTAEKNPELAFYIAYTAGTRNLNGYTDLEMGKMFASPAQPIPQNIVFERHFHQLVFPNI